MERNLPTKQICKKYDRYLSEGEFKVNVENR